MSKVSFLRLVNHGRARENSDKLLLSNEQIWYAKGSLPLYTCVVAGLLSNQMMLDDRIIAKIKEFR